LNRVNAVEVVSKRRANYALLRQSLSDLPGMRFLWEAESLADGICPLGVPVLVNNRRQWWRRLNAAGVVVSCWWEGYHRAIDWSEFPEARMLKDRLILLPVHQGLGRQHMQYIAETVRDIRTDMT
jgi:dTDP-4-amino-4,6-dideoxygalactose transaminase